MLAKILLNIVTLGAPAIIAAIAKARREKRQQEADLAIRIAEAKAKAVNGKPSRKN